MYRIGGLSSVTDSPARQWSLGRVGGCWSRGAWCLRIQELRGICATLGERPQELYPKEIREIVIIA